MRSDNMPRPFAPEHSESEQSDLLTRLRDHAELHEDYLAQTGDAEQRQWAEDLREAADEIERARIDIGEYQRNLDSEVSARLEAESELSKLRERMERGLIGEVVHADFGVYPPTWMISCPDQFARADENGEIVGALSIGKRVRLVVEDE